jgi:integrase
MTRRQGNPLSGTKRGNNEGSIVKRSDGRWMARLTLPDGTRKTIYAKTRQEASRLLASAIRDRDSGLPVVGDRQTVGQFLESWLESSKHSVRPRTWKRRGEYVRLHLIPTIGKIALSKLTAQQVQSLYARKVEEGLSTTTVHHLHAVLHRALETALRLGLVQRNVASLVDAPRMRHHEMSTLSHEQVGTLLLTARGDRFEALYLLAITTGMRQGELLALRWRDVDLDNRILKVRATLQFTAAGFVFAEPKTSRSRRRIAISVYAAEALQRHRERQEQERTRLGDGWTDRDLVFPNSLGKPQDGIDLLRYSFRPLLMRAGLPRIRFHDLRHTAATLLLRRGVNPKIVSEMLGHSSVAITLDIYSHVVPDMQQLAADAMDETLQQHLEP